MDSSETEFNTMVNMYRYLVEKYAGAPSESSTKRVTTSSVSHNSFNDPYIPPLTSPFDSAWSTSPSVRRTSDRRLTDVAPLCAYQDSLSSDSRRLRSVHESGKDYPLHCGSGTNLVNALSRVLDGLKERNSATQPLQWRNSGSTWPLNLASLEYAKSLATLKDVRTSEVDMLSRELPPIACSFYQDFNRTEGIIGCSQSNKRKATGECIASENVNKTVPLKKPRLVWTKDLHKCFEDAVDKLGRDKAVPKAILEEMNVDGITRQNVASHLQKYRERRNKIANSKTIEKNLSREGKT